MKRVTENKTVLQYILILQESFGAAIPFLFLVSALVLLHVFLVHFNILPARFTEILVPVTSALSHFSSLVIAVSAAYFFAVRFKIVPIVVILLTIAVYSTLAMISYPDSGSYLFPGFSVAMLYAPLMSAFLLYYLYPYLSLRIPLHDANRHIYLFFNYMFVFFFAYIFSVLIYYGLHLLSGQVFTFLRGTLEGAPKIIYFTIRDFLVQCFWFLGLPGENTVSLFFPYTDFTVTIVPNLSWLEFNRIFINIGGAGAGLAILIAAMFHAKTRTLKTITWVSVPLALFNINTLLLYAFVVLNRFLLLPFLLVPMINLLLGYLFVQWNPSLFSEAFEVVWNTPVFLDVYLKTEGSILTIVFQLFLLLIDVAVYMYFMKRFLSTQVLPDHLANLAQKLDLKEEVESEKNLQSYQSYIEIIDANAQLDHILEELKPENLFVYYQPKITLSDSTCTGVEALIRYQREGKMIGPFFLDTFEKAGMAPVIDLWVSTQVCNDLERWEKEDFTPLVSINLHPDTLLNPKAIERIRVLFHQKRVMFEILERSFIRQQDALENLQLLQQDGHLISIDDFGIGYSNLWTLFSVQTDELKLDKSLIDKIHEPKAYKLCQSIIQFCHEAEISVVAEGVEQLAQLEALRQLNIDKIQGFYYSKAIPFDEIREYCCRERREGRSPKDIPCIR